MKYLISLLLLFSVSAFADDDPPCTVPTRAEGSPVLGWQCRLSTCGGVKEEAGNQLWVPVKSKYEIDVIDSGSGMTYYPVFINVRDFHGEPDRDYKVIKLITDVHTHLIIEDRPIVTAYVRKINDATQMMIRMKDQYNVIQQTHVDLPVYTDGRDTELLFSIDNEQKVVAVEFVDFPGKPPLVMPYPAGVGFMDDVKIQYGAFGSACDVAPTKYELKVDYNHWVHTQHMN